MHEMAGVGANKLFVLAQRAWHAIPDQLQVGEIARPRALFEQCQISFNFDRGKLVVRRDTAFAQLRQQLPQAFPVMQLAI